jgi:RNA polymerase sigma-70 factor (ECF subfamily)
MESLAAPLAAPELLAALRRGNAEAIAAVYREHAPALLRSIGAVLGDRSDAEDVVHDLFVGLPEAMAHYEERGIFGGWLRRIGMRMALTKLRSRERQREVPLGAVDEPGRAPEGDRLPDRLLVEAALTALPEESRVVVVLRDLEGWSYRDIAEFVGASEGTVMTRHCRAMQRLKSALEEIR